MELEDVINYLKSGNAEMMLQAEKSIILTEASIAEQRAGQDSDPAYKLVASCDSSILPMIPGMMLGPSQEFAELCIVAGCQSEDGENAKLYGHLTSAVQRGSRVQLHIVIDGMTPRSQS